MKYLLPFGAALLFFTQLSAQQMFVKTPNFSSFHQDQKKVSKLLLQKSSPEARQHPEFGILPYNAQCRNCVELIDKRTVDSRFFIDPDNARHTWSQKSYFPLHYKKSADDVWHTIDKRLKPDVNNPGVYSAMNQPVPTKYDVNKKTTSVISDGLELEFNKNLTLYFFDANVAYTKPENADYSNFSIGEEGVRVKNIWKGIDMSQVFSVGRVETNYLITAPLQIPINSGWMVIEDHFTLPEGVTIEEAPDGKHLDNGYYSGDYILKNQNGDTAFIYQRAVYLDSRAFGQHGVYKLVQKGNNCLLQTLIPVSWLKNPDNQYPLCIDPILKGVSKLGNFESSGGPGGNFGFTSMYIGSCDYSIPVTVPGHSTLTNAYVDLEYFLTHDNTCGTPPEPAPYCTFSQVKQTIINDGCNTSTGVLSCNQGQGFISPSGVYSSSCTTDSVLAPGAHSILINNFAPDFLSCIQHQCGDYNLSFTLKNQDSICGDVCGYLCANGDLWQMTVEAVLDSPGIVQTFYHIDSLISSYSSGSNQWYRNDTVLDGDTSAVLVITQPGNYFNSGDTVYGCPPDTFYFPNPNPVCAAYFVLYPAPYDTSTYWGVNYSTGDSLSYLWNFGDGDTSTSQYPNHTYDTAGYYNVCLTVSNDSCTNSFCDSSFYAYKQAGYPMKQIDISATGIATVQASPAVTIYPNPTNSKLMIRTSNMHATNIAIYDIDGRKVWQQNFASEINISQLTPGIYTIEITGAEGSVRKRLEKM